jgi:hypothetical protein
LNKTHPNFSEKDVVHSLWKHYLTTSLDTQGRQLQEQQYGGEEGEEDDLNEEQEEDKEEDLAEKEEVKKSWQLTRELQEWDMVSPETLPRELQKVLASHNPTIGEVTYMLQLVVNAAITSDPGDPSLNAAIMG